MLGGARQRARTWFRGVPGVAGANQKTESNSPEAKAPKRPHILATMARRLEACLTYSQELTARRVQHLLPIQRGIEGDRSELATEIERSAPMERPPSMAVCRPLHLLGLALGIPLEGRYVVYHHRQPGQEQIPDSQIQTRKKVTQPRRIAPSTNNSHRCHRTWMVLPDVFGGRDCFPRGWAFS